MTNKMIPDEEVVKLMRAARKKSRGYADFFGWRIDRDIEEWGVVASLAESLEMDDGLFFSDLKPRGRANDPPDCEARSSDGSRIAIEVTELVDEDAIKAFKQGRIYDAATWDGEKLIACLTALICRKNDRFLELKEPPYDGGYIVVVFTDEPLLGYQTVSKLLENCRFSGLQNISRALLLLSYDPEIERCPYFELAINR